MIIQVEALSTGTSYSLFHTAPGNAHDDTDFARKLLKEYPRVRAYFGLELRLRTVHRDILT